MTDYNPRRGLTDSCLWLIIAFVLGIGAIIAAVVTLIVSLFIGGK